MIYFFSVSTPGTTTPKATSKKQQLAEKKTTASTKKQQSNKKSVKNNNPSSKSSIAAATATLADANDPLNTSTGYHDLEDFEIITEHSFQDLEHIANFCHCGIYPPLSSECTNLFQDFGINILSYLNPVKSEDTKDGILDVLVEPEINEFDTAEFSDDVESPPSPIVFKRKPGTYWLISN